LRRLTEALSVFDRKVFLMTTPAAAAGLEHLDEVLQEQEGRLAGADGEVLLHLLALLAAEGRVGEDHVHSGPCPECRPGSR
jgi:hypothetical protein